jgi:hypothetical protein
LAGGEGTSLRALRFFCVSYELIIPTGISYSGILHEDLNLRGPICGNPSQSITPSSMLTPFEKSRFPRALHDTPILTFHTHTHLLPSPLGLQENSPSYQQKEEYLPKIKPSHGKNREGGREIPGKIRETPLRRIK